MDSWSGGTGILQWLYGVEMLCVSSGQMTRVAPEFGDHQPISTSRAARGGGGSFKNRKRIGEIDCCE